ncbi:MAG: RNA polymerase sigma factor [Thermoguttaceae bacterium]
MARIPPTDEQLVEGSRRGSEEAMVALYERYRPRVIGFALRMTGDRDLAEDVFGDTFAVFFRTLERYESRGQLSAYLLRIARSKLADEIKARLRFRPAPWEQSRAVEEPASPLPLAEELVQSAELATLARRCLSNLSTNLREVVVLRLYGGLDYTDIAEVVGVSTATARSRMRYALHALRQAMENCER